MKGSVYLDGTHFRQLARIPLRARGVANRRGVVGKIFGALPTVV